jgi:hypothetical protein
LCCRWGSLVFWEGSHAPEKLARCSPFISGRQFLISRQISPDRKFSTIRTSGPWFSPKLNSDRQKFPGEESQKDGLKEVSKP